MKSTPALRFSTRSIKRFIPAAHSLRIFNAGLLCFLMLTAPLAPLFAATNRASMSMATRTAGQPPSQTPQLALEDKGVTPAAVGVTATLADDITLAAKKNPGDVITYTAVITTGGVSPADDATGVVFTDTLDINTTLVPGSLNAQPIAKADAYTGSGNIPISIAAPGVLANDIDPMTGTNTGLTVTEVNGSAGNVGVATNTTALGAGGVAGSVNLASTGNFTYEPPPGYTGTDTFTYKTSEGVLTDTNTVTITISNLVWFIKNTGGGLNRGTFSNPFTTIASFNTANALADAAPNPKSGDLISLRSGTYSEADGVNLRGTQKLVGEAVQFNTVFTADSNSSSAYTTFAAATNTAPTINTTTGNGIDLAGSNTVRGLNVGNTPGFFGFNGTAVGSPTINTVNVTGTGGAINVTTSGTFGATVSFGTLESSSSPGANINLVGVTGTLGVTSGGTGLTGSAASSNAINISGGSVGFTYPGDITKASLGALLSVSGGHTGTLTFNTGTLTASAGSGFQFDNADGTYNFNGTNSVTSGASAGINIQNGSGGTFTFSSNSSITNPSAIAYREDTSTPTVTYNGTIGKNNAANAVSINAKTGGTTNFNGGITATTTTANAINLTSNTSGTINFNGSTSTNGLSLTTTTGIAFNATGGGTISVSQNNTTIVNTLTSTTGTALNVTSTTIGASGLTFRSISSNGGTNGIVLNTTGATAGLTVSGNGGTCSSIATCTGGTIQNKTVGVSLNNTTSFSVDRMFISATANSGINGVLVNNFSFTNGKIDNSGTALGTGDSNIAFNTGEFSGNTGLNKNISGTLTITGNTLTNAYYSGIDVYQFDGTISNVNISNNTWTSSTSTASSKSTAILLQCLGSASTVSSISKGTINSNTINNFPSNAGIFVSGGNATSTGAPAGTYGSDTTTNIIAINSNVITGQNAAAGIGTQGIAVTLNGRGTGFFSANSNSITNVLGNAIQVSAFGLTTLNMFVIGNTINAHNINNSQGIGVGTGNTFAASDTPTLNIKIGDGTVGGTNNITNTFGNGILAVARSATGHLNVRILRNSVGTPIENPPSGTVYGIRVDAGNLPSVDDAVCLEISNNTTSGNSGGGTTAPGIGLRKQGTNATVNDFGIVGMAATSSPGVENYVNGLNPGSASGNFGVGGTALISASSGFSNCSEPGVLAKVRAQRTNRREDLARATVDDLFLPAVSRPTEPVNAHALASVPKSFRSVGSSGLNYAPKTPSGADNTPMARFSRATASAEPFNPKAGGTSREIRLNHAAKRPASLKSTIAMMAKNRADDRGLSPLSGETVTVNGAGSGFTIPGGHSVTITFQATVNTPPTARLVSTQGKVSGSNFVLVNGITTANPNTNDPETAAVNDATVTNINVLSTWTGATSTDWNTFTNWSPNTYAPGVSNPAVNDVVIPNVGNQPNIGAAMGDVNIYSLNIANGRTLTIDPARILTIGGSPGGDLTLDGIIAGGQLRFGTGVHAFNNAGGTGSLSPTNQAFVISGSTVTLNNNLQAGLLAVSAGGSMNITNRTLSLNGAGAALGVAGTFTTTGSTIILDGTAAQTIAGTTYNNLTINNTIAPTPAHITGVTLIGNATVNGALTLTSSDLDTGANTLTMPNTATSSGVSDVVGNVKRTSFALAAPLSFGNPNNLITITAGTPPSDINVNLAKSAPAGFALAVQRTYTITPTGGSGITATLRLHYLNAELNSNDASTMIFRRFNGNGWTPITPTSRVIASEPNNWLEKTGQQTFSPWTFSSTGAPTATSGSVSGRITDAQGASVEGAVVRLNGTQNRKFITDANGYYRFDNVETSGFYVVTPSRANYTFTPAQRSFNLLGENTDAAFGATVASGSNYENPLDTPEYFVRQHYLDFLGREPDEAGFNFWSDQIINCGLDQECIEGKRENVSAAYFLSIEFQNTGGLVDGLYRASYGAPPQFAQFMPDARTVAQGVVVGDPDWQTTLLANKQAFAAAFVNRPAFHAMYDSMDNSLFVDTLISHTGVAFTSSERNSLVDGLANGTLNRASALQNIAENQRFVDTRFNQAFVLMEYFGYLRRDPDAAGYQFWLNKLNQFNGNFEQAEMVKAFIVSGEYRNRFPR